jgi:hypothetical protein
MNGNKYFICLNKDAVDPHLAATLLGPMRHTLRRIRYCAANGNKSKNHLSKPPRYLHPDPNILPQFLLTLPSFLLSDNSPAMQVRIDVVEIVKRQSSGL